MKVTMAANATVEEAVTTLQLCGVVAFKHFFTSTVVKQLRGDIEAKAEGWLKSRRTVRESLARAMLQHRSLRQVWEEVKKELIFKEGERYRFNKTLP